MRITGLEYINLITGNTFGLKFNNGLTLLVGMSGAGKTRILNSILSMRKIALGDISQTDDIMWALKFTADGSDFTWSGKIENGLFKEETLEKENMQVYKRLPGLSLQGVDIPQISGHMSILSVFWGVAVIKEIYDEIKNIYMINANNIPEDSHVRPYITDDKKITGTGSLSCSDYNIYEKMAIAWKRGYSVFEDIKEDFITVFPMVEDMKYDYDGGGREYMLYIREKNTDWIGHINLSSGMKKGLYHIACFNLLPAGSVLLIDELENSMGIKCLDLVSDMISRNERDFQIIITSHHPYVINNVDMAHWQVVLREGNRIYTKNKDELGLGRSHHDAFKQLMNLDEYMEGIF